MMANDEPTPDRRTTGEDRESVQDAATRRSRERAERAERASTELEGYFGEFEYPVSSETLATEYGDQTIDMMNETESLGSVFDRLADEQYETPQEVREAVYRDISGAAGGEEEYNTERDIETIDESEHFEEDDVMER
jgi:hypothetical protein